MQSLVEFVSKYAANGGQTAVRQRRGYRMASWTYADIAREANRAARELERRGIAKGDAVLLWAENSAEWIIVFLGCLLRGAVVVPIDHHATAELTSRVAREVRARLGFCSSSVQRDALSIPCLPLESMVQTIEQQDPSPYSSPPLSRQDTLEIIFTSGTTADPRGIVISHGNVLANLEPMEWEIRKYLRYERLVHPIRFLNLLPLSHVFGQMLGIFIPPLLAGTVVFGGSLKPAELAATIRQERISVLVAVPRFLELLQRGIERQLEREGRAARFRRDFTAGKEEHFLTRWWRFRRVRASFGWKFWAVISGGATLPEQVETFWKRLGYAVIQGYGMTETTSLISLNHPFRSTSGSIGRVFPSTEMRVDEHGEVLVRGENVARAYQHQGLNCGLLESDGWFRTGDIAETSTSGQLYFKGRRKNVIVTAAGMKVHPEDLEKALREQPGVRDCVVVGLDRKGNAEPCAVLLLNGSASAPASALENANRSLAEHQKIRNWVIWPEPDFPRTPTLKPILPLIRSFAESATCEANLRVQDNESLDGLIAQITGRKVALNSESANLETDLQLSSLDRVELLSALEDRYHVDLDEVRFEQIATLGQLRSLLTGGSETRVEHRYPTWPQHWLVTGLRLAIYYALAWPATYLLAAPRVRGRQHLRGLHGPALVVSNHVTYLDIAWILPALPARFRNRLATAMGGERLARMRRPGDKLPVFERFLERLNYFLVCGLFNVFPLPTESGFLRSFAFAGNLADRGWNVLVFPEGQTTRDGQMGPFRLGVGLLAKQLNLPVVPMYLHGLQKLKQTKGLFARPGQVEAIIGAPVRFPVSKDASEIARELERRVCELSPSGSIG